MSAPAAKKAAAKKQSDSYVVSGPLIQVMVGSNLLQYSFGDVLPDGIDEDSLKHLTENGLIQKGDEVVAPPESSPDDE